MMNAPQMLLLCSPRLSLTESDLRSFVAHPSVRVVDVPGASAGKPWALEAFRPSLWSSRGTGYILSPASHLASSPGILFELLSTCRLWQMSTRAMLPVRKIRQRLARGQSMVNRPERGCVLTSSKQCNPVVLLLKCYAASW